MRINADAVVYSPERMMDEPDEMSSEEDSANSSTQQSTFLGASVQLTPEDVSPGPALFATLPTGHIPELSQYRPPKRPRPANARRRSLPGPGYPSKSPLGDRLRIAADRVREQSFKYENLPADSVRLLILRQGKDDDNIHVDLTDVPFERLGRIEFEALSYNWGDDAAKDPIWVQDLKRRIQPMETFRQVVNQYLRRKMYIKYNLFKALYHLRQKDRDILLWVDALCINQENPKEKEVQVSRIADIFIAAHTVLIWLGESTLETERAVKLLHELTDVRKQVEIIQDEQRLPDWINLVHLMKASWFSRRWVIQELALAKNAIVYCGGDAIHWNDLRDGFALFIEYEDSIRERFRDSKKYNHNYHALEDPEPLAAKTLIEKVGDVFRKNAGSGQFHATQGLEALTSSLFAFHATDPRDTINTLINVSKEGVGIASRIKSALNGRSQSMRNSTMILDAVDKYENHIAPTLHHGRKPPPLPSYRKDLLDVYVGYLKWVVDSTGSINILCRHWAMPEKSRQDSGYPELVSLPSWIKLTSDGPFRQDGNSRYRQNGDSLVGLPDRSPYNACDKFSNKAKIKFIMHDASEMARPGPVPMDLRRFAEVNVTGIHLGTVNRSTDPMCGGNVTMYALDMLGWRSNDRDPELKDNIWRPLVAERGLFGNNPPEIWRKSCMDILANYTDKGSINIDMILPNIKLQHTKDFLKRMRQVTWNRRFLEVELEMAFKNATCGGTHHPSLACSHNHHRIGLGPPDTCLGDIVCILYGCTVPCILRPRRSPHGSTGLSYDFIGEMYLYGFMDGEAITMLENRERLRQETEFRML